MDKILEQQKNLILNEDTAAETEDKGDDEEDYEEEEFDEEY